MLMLKTAKQKKTSRMAMMVMMPPPPLLPPLVPPDEYALRSQTSLGSLERHLVDLLHRQLRRVRSAA